MHLRHSETGRGPLWRCPEPVGRDGSFLAPRILCPAQSGQPWACPYPITQGPRECGANGAEVVRSPCVIANSKGGGGAGGGGGGR